MTATPPPAPDTEAQPDDYTTIEAESNERLAQLHTMYADLKAAADDAAAKLKVVTDAIKVELNSAAPTSTRIELAGDNGPRLRLSYSTSMRLDSTRLKRDDPALWARYAKESGSWTLKAAGGAS